jgi:dihydrofolate reductase
LRVRSRAQARSSRRTHRPCEGRRALAKLIYAAIASLDGYIEDAEGKFEWAAPDDEVHAFANELERPVGTHLYGRRMYETMVFWENPPDLPHQPPVVQDFAEIWQSTDKIVYSKTLQTVTSAKTRIEREFDSEAVRQLKATVGRDLTVGGPELAAQAIAAGLVDEYHLLLVPVLVGGGKRFLPGDNVRVNLELCTSAVSATARSTSTTAPGTDLSRGGLARTG